MGNFKDEDVIPNSSKPTSKTIISRALFEDSKTEPMSEPDPNKPDRILDSDSRNSENTGVDVDVLNALPDDIRAEVEAQMKNPVSTSTNFKVEVVMPQTSKPTSNKIISRALFEDSKTEPKPEPEPEKEKVIAVGTTYLS